MILREGRNCWRVERASRASYLIDAAEYFTRFREVVARARRSVMMVGWDVDSRTRLVPSTTLDGGAASDDWPPTLLAFLNAALERRPELEVHVLAWDFSMIYTFEREKLPAYRFAWDGHPRLTFRQDGVHPVGASHHQKLVVVDDQIAFTGGLDLTIRRWDTPEHRADHPHRRDPSGGRYAPIHDVQMIVEGPIAAALGDLARLRWRAATDQAPAAGGPPVAPGGDLWPPGLPADLTDVPLGIARTMRGPDAAEGVPEIHEVLQLTLDSIHGARRFIYVENQYLTSAAAGAALIASLEAPVGPEIVMVLPREECGWLEQSSMGVLRARLLRRLQAADRHGRLRLYHPTLPGLAGADCLNIHSKVMVVDDVLARVGSANLSNRSMGLDTECDLVLDAGGDPRLAAGVALLRNRLLGEHLGVDPALFEARLAERGSLVAAIDSLRGGPRSLEPLAIAGEGEVPGDGVGSGFGFGFG